MDVKAPPALLKAQKLANLLDTAIKLPFIPIKIGLDSIVGLIPGAGDALMLFVSLRIVWPWQIDFSHFRLDATTGPGRNCGPKTTPRFKMQTRGAVV